MEKRVFSHFFAFSEDPGGFFAFFSHFFEKNRVRPGSDPPFFEKRGGLWTKKHASGDEKHASGDENRDFRSKIGIFDRKTGFL